MKCIFCNAEIDQDAQFCPNCGKDLSMYDRCSKCGELLEEGTDFCPHCGTRKTYRNLAWTQTPKQSPSSNNKLFGWKGIMGVIALLALLCFIAYGAVVYSCDRSKNQPHDPDPDYAEAVDSDSIENAEKELLEKQKQDSLAKVVDNLSDSIAHISDSLNKAKEIKEEKVRRSNSERPFAASSSQSNHRTSTGSSRRAASVRTASVPVSSRNLGYATFKGSWPNDVNGRMVFKSSHVIDSKDSKGRVAEAGDYVIGEWADGHLVQGIWYGADHQVKGSVIIGR